ncbi:hypothetical protein B0920_10565 [Massilia sp. KIM]|uniref:DUF2939 domain-containing protein n=1 Tax=Massilia sp. KIM TaxID=1955422 RepID=UPI0009D3AD4C|nr:DUF2939 domain-containing protein [Massilia sp. KIM]OON63767.1 hypothetical protein B0920_10565 [Massilia sp. KIM]
MRHKILLSLGAAALIGVGAYWYWSPYLALHSLREAVRQNDPDAFNAHIDYPKLRESMKGQLSSLMTRQLGAASGGGDAMESAGASLGSMLGLAMVDKLMDAMVTPEAVMHAMQNGGLRLGDNGPKAKTATGKDGAAQDGDNAWHSERKNADLLIVYAGENDKPAREKTGFVMAREGFAQWKLTEVRFPAPGN